MRGKYLPKLRPFADERGAALVEFTIVLPILLMLTFGVVQYGMLFLTYNNMQNVARDVARSWAVGELADEAEVQTEAAARRAGAAGWVPAADWSVATNPATGPGGGGVEVSITVPSGRASVISLPLIPMPETISVAVLMRKE